MTGRLRRWCWKWLGLGKLEKTVEDLQLVVGGLHQEAGEVRGKYLEQIVELKRRVSECERGLGECEKELELEGPEEHGTVRRRRLWLQELEKQGLTVEERREWESGM